jgi:glycosyltransferase involved in cell wall biosynthesis
VPIPIIATGMHRSGSSLVASWLSALGVDMGQELLPTDKGNPRGYFEDIGFLEFQRRVLSECCRADDGGHPDWGWTESEQLNREAFKDFIPAATSMLVSRAEGRRLWGWKDPRTTLLLDFWDTLLDGAYYIFVYRFPWDVADSMQRLGEPLFLRKPEYAYRIWSFYNRHIRDFFIKNSHRCVLLSIHALRQNPDRLVDLLCKKLNLEIREANLRDIYQHELFACTEGPDGYDPLIDLVAATSPECTKLLAELDNLADLSGSGFWRARPLRSRPSEGNNLSAPHQVDVSVIIPCRDDGQFLIEAIASFERVAPKNSQLIVVNDGSTELRTLEILKILREAGYSLLDQAPHGLSAARNAGISQASGRYILPLDADNRMRAGFVEAAIEILDSTSEIGIVYGYRQFFGMKTGLDEVAEFDLEEMLTFNYIDAGAVFRREVWADCDGYDQRMSPLEDWDLWISAAEKGWRFHRLPQVTFEYRVRPGSLLSMVDNAEFLDHLFESLMTKHYEIYQPRLVKQLAKMKRSAAHLTVSFRRLSEENDLLRKELLAAKSGMNKSGAMITGDPAPEPKQLPQPAERPADKLDSRGCRLLTYVRRTGQKAPRLLTSWKNRFRIKRSNEDME